MPFDAPVDLPYSSARHSLGVAALGDVVAVLAVGGDDVVGRAQGRDRADAHGLLADAEVQEAADLALRVRLGRRLFDAADGQHLAIELRQELRAPRRRPSRPVVDSRGAI